MQFIHIDQQRAQHQPTNIQTPTKKTKKQAVQQPNTADSIDVLTTEKDFTFDDIDPKQLFQRFHQIIKISEATQDTQEDEEPTQVYRKLDYQINKKAKKLDFQPKSASMSKKNRIKTIECPQKQVKQNFMSIKPIKIISQNQGEITLQEMEDKNLTPQRKENKSQYLLKTAKKQDPYRDIIRKN